MDPIILYVIKIEGEIAIQASSDDQAKQRAWSYFRDIHETLISIQKRTDALVDGKGA